jgi:transposase
VLPQGTTRFTALVSHAIDDAAFSEVTRELFSDLVDQLRDVDRRIRQIGARLAAICRVNEACRRLVGIPGVGPIVATALVAAIADGRQFCSDAILLPGDCLVPRQYTTGGKPRLGHNRDGAAA